MSDGEREEVEELEEETIPPPPRLTRQFGRIWPRRPPTPIRTQRLRQLEKAYELAGAIRPGSEVLGLLVQRRTDHRRVLMFKYGECDEIHYLDLPTFTAATRLFE